jgi:hypothetical protein
MMAMPDENNEDDLAKAGQLGHEIDHMMHPALSGTLRGEVHAYDIQYKIYKNMGIEDNYHENGDVWVAAYGSSLKGASNKELRNSEIARQNPEMPVNTLERVFRDLMIGIR